MSLGLVLFLGWTALEVVLVAASIIWCVENGQFKHIEDAKYRILEDLEPQGWTDLQAEN